MLTSKRESEAYISPIKNIFQGPFSALLGLIKDSSIIYQGKVRELLNDIDMYNYGIEFDLLSEELILSKVDMVLKNQHSMKQNISKYIKQYHVEASKASEIAANLIR